MLRSLLTPLTARFDLSPRQAPQEVSREEDAFSPEDFARDVLIELMRNAVERLKEAYDFRAKIETLAEIHRIMLEHDGPTLKDVFREMDGFLALIGFLASAHSAREEMANSPVQEPQEQVLADMLEGIRLAFVIADEGLKNHEENVRYFENRVGYESLTQALLPLASDSETRTNVFGLVASLALSNFAFSSLFTALRASAPTTPLIDHLSNMPPIRHPGAIRVLWDLLAHGAMDDMFMRVSLVQLLDHLAVASQRNMDILTSLGLVRDLFALSRSTAETTERHAIQKLLKRLLERGCAPNEARDMFTAAVHADNTLDADVLDLVRAGMRGRCPAHFSMRGKAALAVPAGNVKGLPATGFSLMTWIWVENPPIGAPHTIFGLRLGPPTRWIVQLCLRQDGHLQLDSSGQKDSAVFTAVNIRKGRWVHIAVVHHPHRASNPTIRVFIDGVLTDSSNRAYPKPENNPKKCTYLVGDDSPTATMNWSIASAYLISMPLHDDLPRLIHRLGPRYSGAFQASDVARFLTYEASTALSIQLASTVLKPKANAAVSPLMKAIRDGLGILETSFVFALVPASFGDATPAESEHASNGDVERSSRKVGDVFLSCTTPLDEAIWALGGAAIPLRFVQLANTSHELSRSLAIFRDCLRYSWQNSEDMERLRGYDILARILKDKAQLINMTGFESLFECLGLNFRNPEQSTIINNVAYLAVALDFELWAQTKPDIQRVHLDHFTTLLKTSRHKRFNGRQRLSKLGIVRKLLFVLQTDWYALDVVPNLIEALRVASIANFATDDVIKPTISFLAAHLHEDTAPVASPVSIISRRDRVHCRDKAEYVFGAFVAMLTVPGCYAKFAAALPVTRICLLLLGDRPSGSVAANVLQIIAICVTASTSFSRKFELVSGWSILKAVLPDAWDAQVHKAAFDLALGRLETKQVAGRDQASSVCPHIVPAILAALGRGLTVMARGMQQENGEVERANASDPATADSNMEPLIEELITVHSSIQQFRQIFKSQQTTQLFIDAFKSFVLAVSSSPTVQSKAVRMLEKLMHLAMSLALDNDVAGSQKRELLDIIGQAENIIDAGGRNTAVDPKLVTDQRSLRRRITARLSLQVGERTIQKSFNRIQEWRKTIIEAERKRLRKHFLDLRENNRQVDSLSHWSLSLASERGLWRRTDHERLWHLDETEGPYRIRKKMESTDEEILGSHVDAPSHLRNVEVPEADAQSTLQVEVPPWAEAYEISSTDVDGQLAEDVAEDKHRRVRHELEPDDVIEAVNTVARISGVDSSPGLLIFGRTHLYMLNGLVENDDGEVIDVHDAPKRLFFVPGSHVEIDNLQRAQRWTYEQVTGLSDRTFLFRDVALEIYFRDCRSLLVVFLDKKSRQDVNQRLHGVVSSRRGPDVTTPGAGLLKTPVFSLGSRVLASYRHDELSTAQRKWQAREISNFTYLSILNQISGRTPSDATQYPIFPWVLKDYTSATLDLSSPDSFRDLSCPMGGLSPARREAALGRFTALESIGEKPFHYGTHFSSSMIVCHFLIRMEPFTHMFKTLQGGDWDLPDRLFSDMNRAYESASNDARGDVRELIPEFFTCPEFLENSQNLDFGVQNTGERIHHVKLPPWAKEDPMLFITLNRKALESDHVSEHLPAWIDLIWGCKQRDPDSLNVFHPLSYEGSIDLDAIEDELEREATVGIIHNFGQTPRKLFTQPHPPRYMHGLSTLPIGSLHGIEEDYNFLQQSQRAVKDMGAGMIIRDLVVDLVGERVIPCEDGRLCVPDRPHEQIEWGPSHLGKNGHGDIRVVVDRRVVQVVEMASCSCAAFADSSTLVTGSTDHALRLWRRHYPSLPPSTPASATTNHNAGPLQLALTHVMRAHTAPISCVTASRAWSIIVSGARDGSAVFWDLNRAVYVRSIWHSDDDDVHLAAINESTGYIATCSRSKLCLHTLNGRPIATISLTSAGGPSITSLAFLEREYSHLGVLATGTPDGCIALRTWEVDPDLEKKTAEWRFKTLRILEARRDREKGGKRHAITALKFVGERLYHAEDSGRAYSWDLPD